MSDAAYTARYTTTFPPPDRVSHHDSTIVDDAERGARAKVRELHDPDIFYAAVPPRDLLDHLQLSCGGLHALDVLALQNDMQRFHLDAEGMPEYINALEDAQKQSRRAHNDITDATLLLMATNVMLATQRFP